MTEQNDQLSLPLTGQAPQNWRTTDPHTSKEAGVFAAFTFRSEHQILIFGVIKSASSPVSAEQIADALGWESHVPVNRRLSELRDGGVIREVDSDYRNRSGRSALRWAVK